MHYQGRRGHQHPAYHCPGSVLVEGRGQWCLRVGGGQLDQAVAGALLAALTPAGVKAALHAAESLEADHDAALAQWRLQVERARYQAEGRAPLPPGRARAPPRRARARARLGAGALRARHSRGRARAARAPAPTHADQRRVRAAAGARHRPRPRLVGADHERPRPQAAPALPDRGGDPRCRPRERRQAALTLRWRGGALTELAVALPRRQPAIRTDEDTIALLERLAAHYPDATIAGILNRQGRRSATGERFTAIIVGGLRRYRASPAHEPPAEAPDGELLPIAKAAEALGIAPSTLHRWLGDGFIAGEQDTPGAPWRIRVNDQLRALFVEEAGAGFVPIVDAMRTLGVSRQTVLQRVKRGELEALHVRRGRRKGLRIRIPAADGLFDPATMNAMAV